MSVFQDDFRLVRTRPKSGFMAMLDTFVDVLEHAAAQIDHPKWGYLVQHVDAGTGLGMAIGLELASRAEMPFDEELTRMVEPGLTEPELLDRLRTQLESAPISNEHRDQLNEGLAYVAARKYHLAVPMLLSPLEGRFWRAAEERDLVEQSADGKWFRKRPRRTPIAITEVFDLEDMPVDERFSGFARGLAYGGGGNQHRHGTADDGWHLRALALVVSLVEWLDLQGLVDAQDEIKHACIRADDKRRGSTNDLDPTHA